MSSAVKISDHLLSVARVFAKTYHRSTAGQIEYWAKIGQLAEENPDLPYHFIHDMLIGLEELKANQTEPYIFSGKRKL